VYEQRLLSRSLGIGLVVGWLRMSWISAQIIGNDEPLGLVADLLYALGWALWTSVVVVMFVQTVPEAKRRQLKGALDGYQAGLREQAEPEATGLRASGRAEQPPR
jgi:hypothetical protein